MSVDRAVTPDSPTAPATGTAADAALVHRPGRWIDNWNAEDREQWQSGGKAIARRNLQWSIACEFLGFVVWQLWSIVVVYLPAAGFNFSTAEIFWLISMPSLVGATLRIPYTFMVPRFGGRNWTIISALLLLIPSIGLGIAVSNPETPFAVMLTIAALAGFGGGNFASSMANITFFYPVREKGWALGLNAAGGNLGAAVAQLVVPLAIAAGAATTLNLPLAGWIWVPLILVAAFGAWKYMDNLSSAKSDLAGSIAALREPHLWVMAFLYIGTFGSFIGFSGVFPKLILDSFPEFSTFALGPAALSLAFLGPLVGSLARPYGGRLADRWGGARITVCAFAVMALVALTVVWTLPLANFWLFLGLFLVLFAAAGAGNGSTYRMIPVIFALRGKSDGAMSTGRKAAAALGLISAIGAYGGFVIPQVLNASKGATGGYDAAFYGFVAAYALMLTVTWFFYLRRSRSSVGHV
ncbi:MFS transporter [Arthrobacter sp. JZ12]|uniref:MFS transporter n=1 Tax=Arthrobacter sp. JZ12 TaxID=2654190 RepID=UPI002B49F52C|nr:MFS transporter [Arthrobacter sp. JZ12]WRH24499.1 MFS transporter [Arthrobacter sp. JZ12]